MAYADDIANTGADHHWELQQGTDFTDQIGSATLTSNAVQSDSPIAEDATLGARLNNRSSRYTCPDQTDINSGSNNRRAVGGWFMADSIQDPPCCVYHEGDTVNLAILIGWGNEIMFQYKNTTIVQVFGDRALTDNRPYHLFMKFSGTTYDSNFRAWIDGVELTQSEPADQAVAESALGAHSVIEWGGVAAGAGGMQVGPNDVLLVSAVDGHYNHWATWSGANAQDLDTATIREELFEKGALASTTISAGTEAAMQTSLDALADSVRPDVPLCIRVEAVTGDGDLTLTADNITFDALASIHVQYMGTGTLTWVNDNGGDAAIGSTPAAGTIVFETPVPLSVTCLDASDQTPIQNARVRMVTDPGDVEVLAGLTNVSGVLTGTFPYLGTNEAVTVKSRKGDGGDPFKEALGAGVISAAGMALTLQMVPD